jgi:hypothetical protein
MLHLIFLCMKANPAASNGLYSFALRVGVVMLRGIIGRLKALSTIERDMHSMRRGITGRIGGFAALCAILLLSIAPLASQWLAHARAEGALFASLCASGAKADIEASQHASHDAIAHFDACGYCNLVTHAPPPPVIAQNPVRAIKSRALFADAAFIGSPRHASRTHTHSRAPPFFA